MHKEQTISGDEYICKAFFTTSHLMLALLDRDFNFIKVNKAFAEADNRSEESYVGKNFFDLYPDKEREAVFKKNAANGDTCTDYEKPFVYPGKSEDKVIYCDYSLQPVNDPDNRIIGLFLCMIDVTRRKKASDRILGITKQFQSVLEDNPISISFKNLRHEYDTVNDTKADFFGLPSNEIIGKTDSQLIDSDLSVQIRTKEESVIKTGKPIWTEECYIGNGGEKSCQSTMIKPWRNENDEIIGTITFGTNITKHKEWEEYIRKLAHFDELTGLPNRTLLMDRLKEALKRCRREEDRLALLFLDLDGFKAINDTMGHSSGDELLKLVAERLKRSVRETDTVARLGGDEFIILLEAINDDHDAVPIAEKILKEIGKPFLIKDENKFISTSIGISLYPKSADSEEELIKKADIAMYGAKESGRNRYKFFEFEMDVRVNLRLKTEEKLRQALENDEFELFYQPQISVPAFFPDHSVIIYNRENRDFYALHPQRARDFATLIKMPQEAFFGEYFLGDMNLKQVYHLPPELINEAHFKGMVSNFKELSFFEGKAVAPHGNSGMDKYSNNPAKTVCVEALIRWRQSDKNNNEKIEYLSPKEFILIAEDSGLIVPISEWVLKTACRQNKIWQDMGLPPIIIAVNISGRHFRSKRLIDSVSTALTASELRPGFLKLELTENIARPEEGKENDQFIVKLRELNSMGVKLSIDDFGTAYSSLRSLADLRGKKLISELKIAQEFIKDITIDDGLKNIVRTIIEMGRALQMKIVAEGVETQNQLELLRFMGCETVQGYLFSIPLQADKCTEYLKEETLNDGD